MGGNLVVPILEEINSRDQIMHATYWDIRMKQYHMHNNVVFLGDAAHSMFVYKTIYPS